MDLARYVDTLRTQLLVAAEAGGDEARTLAARLVPSLEAAARLALLEALSAAADEITTDLAPGSVDLRLRGLDPEFVVTPAPVELAPDDVTHDVIAAPPPPRPAPSPAVTDADDGGTARITLRLPEHLKNQIEQAAGREALSVNAWLVRATAAALEPVPDRAPPRRNPLGGQHVTGWAR